jgi:hypothetical protein
VLLGAQVAAASNCPAPELGRGTAFDYGKAFVLVLSIANQVFNRNASMVKELQSSHDYIEFVSTSMFTLKLENIDLGCAQRLVEPFMTSKAKGIEESASATRVWTVVSRVSNEQLIDDLKASLSEQSRLDMGDLIDKLTNFRVRSESSWGMLPDLATLSSYAFGDLEGDPNSKSDRLTITAVERAELVSRLRAAFPAIQHPSKDGWLPTEAAAFILHKFLTSDFKTAPPKP